MSEIKDKLTKALNDKNNDVNSFVWKFKKTKVGDKFTQSEIKLMDATEEQLNQFYKHCMTMLYNKDSKNIGRYPLIDLIKDQRNKCNAMLFINWITTGDANRKPTPRFEFFESMRTFLDNNETKIPRDKWNEISITSIMEVPPVEFQNLSIKTVFDACLDALGVFERKHLTDNFIVKLGLWFTQDEMKDLNEKDENGKTKLRLNVVKERCDLRPDTKLYVNQEGLTYKEFRAMKNLKSKRYSELTTDQLTILRDKILFKLEEEVKKHIKQWNELIRQIKLVASTRNITLQEVSI